MWDPPSGLEVKKAGELRLKTYPLTLKGHEDQMFFDGIVLTALAAPQIARWVFVPFTAIPAEVSFKSLKN